MDSKNLLISIVSILIQVIISNHSTCQVLYDFQDPSLSFENQAISGDTSLYKIEDGQLKLSATGSSSPAQLFFASDVVTKAVWQIHLEFDFNPSSSNYAEIFLMSDSASHEQISNGYFVRLGGSEDDIRLYKIEEDQKSILIDGPDNYLDLSGISLDLKATRDSLGNWNLFSKLDAAQEFDFVGNSFDNAIRKSSFFSIKCNFTSTRADKFRFDDIIIDGIPFPDIFSPEIDSLIVSGPDILSLVFNEPFTFDSESFQIISPHNSKLRSSLISEDRFSVQIQFDSSFSNGFIHELVMQNISDESGNTIEKDTLSFLFFEPVKAAEMAVVLNEVFADYNPVEDLPEGEFIEILNISKNPYDLGGWKLSDNRSQTNLDEFILLPDSFLILTSKASALDFDRLGKVMALEPWPTLNNDSDSLVLIDNTGMIIDRFNYDRSFHENEKVQGGWSLELINPYNPCKISSNWTSSIDPIGGTPGKVNSVYNNLQDTIPPSVMDITNLGNDKIKITFSKPVKAEEASFSLNAHFLSSLSPVNQKALEWILPVESLLESNIIYELNIKNLHDCFYNSLTSDVYQVTFDLDSPGLDTVYSVYHNQFELAFNDKIDHSNLEIKFKDLEISIQIEEDNYDSTHITILTDSLFLSPFEAVLIFENLADYNGNASSYSEFSFDYQPAPVAEVNELIITEFMSDPIPSTGLPEVEFVEIFNPSNISFPIRGMKIQDPGNTGIILDGYIGPNEYVILTPTSSSAEFNEFGKVSGVSGWPNLNSSGDQIRLLNQRNDIVYSVEYNDTWYQSITKKEGGWSLEMIDTSNPCGEGDNWSVSENQIGGSPGKSNSVNASKPDLRGPEVSSVIIQSSDTIIITFNEKVDPRSVKIESLELKPAFPINNVVVSDDKKQIILKLSQDITLSEKYEVNISGVTDCNGNILPMSEAKHVILLPEEPSPGDLVLNEILFNPRPGGIDFIEIVNTTNKYLDLSRICISNGKDTSRNKIEFILDPYDYLALSADPEIIINEYPNANLEDVIRYPLPAFPDQEGNIFIFSTDSTLFDKLKYSEEMHFELLKYVEGFSLERIAIDQPADLKSNWTSASSMSSGATPGFQNTQHKQMIANTIPISISPLVFDPGSVNVPFTTIQYSFDKPGYVGTLQVYNLQGRMIKELIDAEYLPQSGFIRWEGTSDSREEVRSGAYIIYFQIFDLEGQIKTFKERVVVATQF
jgi:hypothetical protein